MTRRLLSLCFVLAATSLSALAADDGFVSLFDGKSLDGWHGDLSRWTVEDGAITGRTTEGNLLTYNTFLVWQGGKPRNFELRFKYKIVGGNSGMQYRSRVIDEEKFVVSGPQADIDSSPRYTGMTYEEKARGFLAQRGERVTIAADGSKTAESIGDADELQALVNNEDWNEYRIVARGKHTWHYVNGTLMSEVIDNSSERAKQGILAIQLHQGPPMTLQVKDIELKDLTKK